MSAAGDQTTTSTPGEELAEQGPDALPVLAQEATVVGDPFVGELSRPAGSLPVVQAAAEIGRAHV